MLRDVGEQDWTAPENRLSYLTGSPQMYASSFAGVYPRGLLKVGLGLEEGIGSAAMILPHSQPLCFQPTYSSGRFCCLLLPAVLPRLRGKVAPFPTVACQQSQTHTGCSIGLSACLFQNLLGCAVSISISLI